MQSTTKKQRGNKDNNNSDQPRTNGPSVRFQDPNPENQPPKPRDQKTAIPRSSTFGSISDQTVKQKLRRLESEIEVNIKTKLNSIYKNGSSLYYRIAPDQAPRGTAQNDSEAPGVTLDATMEFLEQRGVEVRIGEIERRISGEGSETS